MFDTFSDSPEDYENNFFAVKRWQKVPHVNVEFLCVNFTFVNKVNKVLCICATLLWCD